MGGVSKFPGGQTMTKGVTKSDGETDHAERPYWSDPAAKTLEWRWIKLVDGFESKKRGGIRWITV
jgi:hypothetical protein